MSVKNNTRLEEAPPNRSLAASTSGQEAHWAYEYWCETVFTGWDADSPDSVQRRAFQARVAGLTGPRGDIFWYQSDAISGRRTAEHCRRREDERAILGLVIAGRRHHQQWGDGTQSAGPGELYCYDPEQPSRTTWEAHRGVHLFLDTGTLRRALGGDMPPPSRLARALQHSPLYPFLRTQLQLLAQHGEQLAKHQQALILEQTVDLAFAALDNCPLAKSPADPRGGGLFVAAERLVRQQMGDPELNAGTLAARLGCSRATLYRTFSERNLTVAGYLREARLQRVQRLLQSAPPHHTIADIAAVCGFMDSASFSRLFRLQYGISPRELRKHSR